MKNSKNAFSLIELIIVVVLLTILTAVALPRFNFAAITRQNAEIVARKITTDLRRTRSLAILNAAENSSGFELQMTGDSPYTVYKIVDRSDSSTVDTHSFDASISCTGGAVFRFGPTGNLLAGSGSQLAVSGGEKSFTISLVTATGATKCVQD